MCYNSLMLKFSKIINLKQFRKYLLEGYGKKCKSYEEMCIECRVWKCYETLKEIEEIDKEDEV